MTNGTSSPTAIPANVAPAALAPIPTSELTTGAAKIAPPTAQGLNVVQQKMKRSKAQEKMLKLREMLWPDLNEASLWNRRTKDGYSTIPRTLPLLIDLINDLAKGVNHGKAAPAGRSYLVLWCRAWDLIMMANIESELSAALEAGYSGERSVTTWREHLRILKALGFIDYKEGPSGPCQYILLMNPYSVVKTLRPKIQEKTYNAIAARAIEIGASADLA